jgi:hypothetical protein
MVRFEEIGANDLFKCVTSTGNGPGDSIVYCTDNDRAVLPHQGYMLVFARRR